jgi:ankyrin repeat protein
MERKVNCDDIRGFNNMFGSCWTIIILSILLYSEQTGALVQNQLYVEPELVIKNPNIYINRATSLVKKAAPMLEDYVLPRYIEYMKNEDNIIDMMAAIIERFNNTVDTMRKQLQHISLPKMSQEIKQIILKRENSIVCEQFMGLAFFKMFDKHKLEDFGGNIYHIFFFMNILSSILLNQVITMEQYKYDEIDLSKKPLGYIFRTPSHAIGLFECNGKYKFVDNQIILDFDFDKFIHFYNLQKQKKSHFNISYQIGYGICIEYYEDNKRYTVKFTKEYIDMIDGDITLYSEPILHIVYYDMYKGKIDDYKINNINGELYTYSYLLENSIIDNNIEKIKEIISKGIKIESLVSIHLARNNAMLKFLLENNADVDIKDNQGNTMLIYAIEEQDIEQVMLLLAHNARTNIYNNKGDTPLIIAIIMNNKEIVNELLNNGADPSMKNINNVSPIQIAIEKGNNKIVKMLIKARVDLKPQTTILVPLIEMVKTNNMNGVKILLENGANINDMDNYTSPLLLAVEIGNMEMVKLLLEYNPKLDIKNKFDDTPLDIARIKKFDDIEKLLLQHQLGGKTRYKIIYS